MIPKSRTREDGESVYYTATITGPDGKVIKPPPPQKGDTQDEVQVGIATGEDYNPNG